MKTRELKLSERLQAVAAMVTEGGVVCDVGCDHGFVPVCLVKSGISPKVIAMDINEGPLQAAREHIGEYLLADYIETRLSDGLEALRPGEADTVICAGMGGRLAVRILEEGKGKLKGVRELILQPQSELQYVREYLRKQGYFIADENMVLEDGKYYPMMRACPAGDEGTGNRAQSWGEQTGPGCKGAANQDGSCTVQAGTDCGRTEDGYERYGGRIWTKRPASERQRLEDKFGPMLLRQRHPVLKAYLQREMDICGQIAESLVKCSRGQAERQQELRERQEDVRTALSFFRMQSADNREDGHEE